MSSSSSETSPLLTDAVVSKQSWRQVSQSLARCSLPFIVANLLQYYLSSSGMLFIRSLGKVELGSASVATTTANITGFFVFQGLATSLDTLCGQAWGSGNPQLARLYVQKMIILLSCVSLPIALLWLFAQDLFALFLPDPATVVLSGLYLRILICAMPGFLAFEAGKRICTSRGSFVPVMGVLFAGACTNAGFGWFLVSYCSLGFVGAPIAVAATWTTIPGYLLMYLRWKEDEFLWPDTFVSVMTGWGPMIRLAVPGLIMMEAEFLAFEILVVLSAQLSTEHLAAQTVLALLNSAFWQIPFSISVAGSTLVAQCIGARSLESAKTTASVVFACSLVFSAVNSSALFIFRRFWPTIFTRDDAVIGLVEAALPLVATMQLFDGMAACCNGLLRGIGRPDFGSWTNILGYYALALPISSCTTFSLGWGLEGLWSGVTVALAAVTVSETAFLVRADWQRSVEDAKARNEV